ncbi:MAG TPA: tetratricopeptide repeat protein [Candidatus Binatia bacterium]
MTFSIGCVLAFLCASGDGVRAQPLISKPLGPEVSPPVVPPQAEPPLVERAVIKEENLGEGSSASSPMEQKLPLEPEPPEAVNLEVKKPGEPMGADLEPQEVRVDQENLATESREGASPQAELSGGSPVPVVPAVDPAAIIAKITPETTPRRAASLRLTEEGRQLLGSGEYQKALQRFEKTIAIDATNPYSYYYLALVHYNMGNHQASANFLDVAESLLSEEPFWLARVFSLKGENLEFQGALEQADLNYGRALQLDPNNKTAFEALTRITKESGRSF